MKTKSKLDLKVVILSVIPLIGWFALILSSLGELPEDLSYIFIIFAILFSLLVIATIWPTKESSTIAFVISLLALIPLYIESQSVYGDSSRKLFPVLALVFVLFYLLLNYLKVKKLKTAE